ncbi:type 1 glutamine amidotransferase [Acaryochloris sp. IP29b_bin.148]|uniref:type 1 glutamine amidotransferase n=1 Tax=Acaryochloris sp. IP29b_bin.148 TaxID=2969218 RepID=UPI002617EFAF|nr:type 1 glutamine amidotransferase [Acaryochloris sp. IP29b_bin.148]
MTPSRSKLRILYLQIRNDDVTCAEELREFAYHSQLNQTQFTILNVFDTPEFCDRCVDTYDALFIGGSSDASVLKPDQYPFVHSAKQLIRHCVDYTIPVFASCFGFQLGVEALGGKVIDDPKQMEMGIYPMQLTDEAYQDPLFADIPNPFLVVSGHKERATELPPQTKLLAFTERCPYHAFKVIDKPFYGFQFHPEVDHHDLAARITRYQDRYLETDGALQAILDNLHPTPESNRLILKFVDRILLQKR